MTKKCLFVCIFSSFITFGVSQTVTKKYNEYQERYEFFDQYGNMTGYQKWNSYQNQWEYYDVKNSSNYKKEYVEPYDFNLLRKGLEYKQNAYESNVDYIQNEINFVNQKFEIFYKYKDMPEVKPHIPRIENLYNKYMEGINKLNNTSVDFSQKSSVNQVLNWLSQFDRELMKITNELAQK